MPSSRPKSLLRRFAVWCLATLVLLPAHAWAAEPAVEEAIWKRSSPGGILYWQWLALPGVLALAAILGVLLRRATQSILGRAARRTSTRWDDELLTRMSGPLTTAWALVVVNLALPWIGLDPAVEGRFDRWLRTAGLAALFWAIQRMVDVSRDLLGSSAWATDHPASRSLLPLGSRVAKVLVLAIAAVALLSELGYPVASLLAGLGIGGLAFALAAQKTVENLFGAFSIGADQPFREGDFVRIEDFVGTVEAIGLRSTRFRTLDRTLISIPNGKLAEMRLESFAARDRIRLACTIGLVYETTSAQLRQVLTSLRRTLEQHPNIWPNTIVVSFKELGAYSLDIEVMAWFQGIDWPQFLKIREEVLLEFMKVVEEAGTAFAFPSQTLHLVGRAD